MSAQRGKQSVSHLSAIKTVKFVCVRMIGLQKLNKQHWEPQNEKQLHS
jgi:hypothetical protein